MGCPALAMARRIFRRSLFDHGHRSKAADRKGAEPRRLHLVIQREQPCSAIQRLPHCAVSFEFFGGNASRHGAELPLGDENKRQYGRHRPDRRPDRDRLRPEALPPRASRDDQCGPKQPTDDHRRYTATSQSRSLVLKDVNGGGDAHRVGHHQPHWKGEAQPRVGNEHVRGIDQPDGHQANCRDEFAGGVIEEDSRSDEQRYPKR